MILQSPTAAMVPGYYNWYLEALLGIKHLQEMFNGTALDGALATLLTQRRGPGLVGVLGHQGGLWRLG